jgi:ATP-binding cassette subfamily C protein
MSLKAMKAPSDSILSQLRLLSREFAGFAGAKGFRALLLVLLGAAAEGIGLVLFVPFISVIIESKNADGWVQSTSTWLFALFSAESRLAKLSVLVILFATLMVARAIIITMRDVTIADLEMDFIQEIRLGITRRLAAAPWVTVSRLRHSRITHLIGTDVQRLESATYILARDTVAVVMLASQIVLAFLLAPLLAASALVVVFFSAAPLLPMIKRARGIGSFVTNTNLSLIDDMTQFLGALKLAISQNLQERFVREFEATLGQLKAQQICYVRQQTTSRLVVASLFALVGAIAMVLGIVVFNISASVLITLLLIVSRMNGPAMQLQLDAQALAHALPAYEKIRELEDDLASAETLNAVGAGPVIDLSDAPIVFSKVSFIHEAAPGSSESVCGVRGLDLIIEPGSIVGITGASGAGKTTFADLLVGLYPPRAGEIRVGGIKLYGQSLLAWRSAVSYVAQDPFLFHDTIRRNFLWANPEADEVALWSVLRMVGAEEIVRNAIEGLDTVVGERGCLLSGGERQRLCLARAMLRRPHLLVLDEATSAVDTEGEHALLGRLLQSTPRPTVVMIAHRLESLRHCQRILQFEQGRIVFDSCGTMPSDRTMSAIARA